MLRGTHLNRPKPITTDACYFDYVYATHRADCRCACLCSRPAYLHFCSAQESVGRQLRKAADCREVAALGRSLAAVGGRLEALLVAAASQGLEEQTLSSSTILAGPAPSASP